MRAQQELRPPCGLSRAEFNIVKVVTEKIKDSATLAPFQMRLIFIP
jgi:hypothetical protein